MTQSIAANDENINSQTTFINRLTTRKYNLLSSFQKALLYFYYQLRLSGIAESDYSRKELSIRLGGKHVDYISRTLAELEALSLLDSKPHGSRNKKRWITYEAFSMLENIRSGQMSDQIDVIPYIDLKDQGSRDINNLKILKGEQICGQPKETDLNEKLNTILAEQRISHQDRTTIKNAINRTLLSEEARLDFASKIGWVMKRKRIQSPRAYFLKALQNENMRREFYDRTSN